MQYVPVVVDDVAVVVENVDAEPEVEILVEPEPEPEPEPAADVDVVGDVDDVVRDEHEVQAPADAEHVPDEVNEPKEPKLGSTFKRLLWGAGNRD